jgi:aromatic-L-amino-acid decarboxylase
VKPGYLHDVLPKEMPVTGESFDSIISDVNKHIVPGVTHWQHPNFYAYFSSNSSLPSLLGDMLSGTFSIVGFSWVASPAATELETVVLDWLARAMNLPEFYLSSGKGGGCIQGTASEAVVVCLLAAKARALEAYLNHNNVPANPQTEEMKHLKKKLTEEFSSKLVVYAGDQAHSSIKKACMIVGISDEHCRILKSNSKFELEAETLVNEIESDITKGLIPIFATATVGTTSSTAVDNLAEIGSAVDTLNQSDYIRIWLHVDAAFAGSACICPEYRQELLDGIEYSNSFNFNPHKWMLTNFDCSALWIKERKFLLDALSITPEYLRNKATESGLVIDYRDWQIPLGRRFRSLKLWFVLRSYGLNGLQQYIRHHIQLAELLEKQILASEVFEMVVPRTLSLVCFRIKPELIQQRTLKSVNEVNQMLLNCLNETGKIFIIHTVLDGVFTLRFAICGTNSQESHVRESYQLMIETANTLLSDLNSSIPE